MSVGGDLLEVDVIGELDFLRVDTENLETASRVRDTDVDFTIDRNTYKSSS